MRLFALAITVVATLLFSVALVSAQTITMSAHITNSSGPVASCPVTINFKGTIWATNWPATHQLTVQEQYKWIRSDGRVLPTRTVNATLIQGLLLTYPTATWTLFTSGTYWEGLQVITPSIANDKSNHATLALTCPTTVNGKKVPGSLLIPAPATPRPGQPGARPLPTVRPT